MDIEVHEETLTPNVPEFAVAALKRLRVLFVTNSERLGAWLIEGFANDCQADVVVEEALSAEDGSARLHERRFDAVVVTHDDEQLNAFEVVLAADDAGFDGPLIVVGSREEAELDGLCYDAGADAYFCLTHATPRALMWRISQTLEIGALRRENDRLQVDNGEDTNSDDHDARRLVDDQLSHFQLPVIDENLDGVDATVELPEKLQRHYQELMRAYIIMGSGNLAGDIDRLTDLLLSHEMSLGDATRLHLAVLDEIVHGLGSRSARHVVDRAGLLSLEILTLFGDKYRQRYLDCAHPPRQLELPMW